MTMTTGEATIRLLGAYGVTHVFGVPGVHTLDFCRGLGPGSAVIHVQARNELGAGFMADGYGRTSRRPGVALTISGPGVTNATTALGQAYADSVPMLLLSADASSDTLGKGWGVLHEVTDLTAVTRPLTGFSACARRPQDVPELLGQAFSLFACARPRPVHIAIPIDVLQQPADGAWQTVTVPSRPQPDPGLLATAAALLQGARRPMILTGGGAAGAPVTALAERLGAIVIASNAGKGVVPDSHPLSLGGATVRREVQRLLPEADVILAIGTEISETDSFIPRLALGGTLIRIDLDPRKINDLYPAAIGIVGDATAAVAGLLAALGQGAPAAGGAEIAARLRGQIAQALTTSEHQHARLLRALRAILPVDTILHGDACQLAYTGAFMLPVEQPRLWHYAAGYCALGYALPNAIGARLAQPERPVVVLAGDGGLMFTVQELITAAELRLPIPVIVWENGGLKQIQDDMAAGRVPRVGVDGINPDFLSLARALHCHAVEPDGEAALATAVHAALAADRPTLILVHEGASWLN